MFFRAAAIVFGILFLNSITVGFVFAECPIKTLVIKGRVEHLPADAKVHVQLVYPRNLGEDSGETDVVNGKFNLPIQFLTQSRRPSINGLFEKCDRKPINIVVTLSTGDPTQEFDRTLLELGRDFTNLDSETDALRSELVLKGPE